ncbi:bifunctional phosphopantothenoylcysteine decarboxylase/phosphopantothenate--cysteine ligase CoaBC [Aestuariibacter sp. AA17]|uniref:Coenzyme A biosynthesis bifunctional protein CoaBC n=1 Tax=Fluctibacter corallii TaxID=2984329 RepID=A0ABT3ABU9_9ALTE|nr:bifunctional phosphopantothenoylcysteine decarboxylase/phosphopantothenate--cysteine ligase CoaBC [Aestuariibacter sp. AA17]MCV2886150.1 bifunctional phosphopantothenoylcysteine decarboxylase/phosphopantothenate--cysteine ligase CoaBC [Aestuariibacter sp. AA17]
MHLQNRNILLGVTGGIAAYKTPDLVRKLKAQGATVRVVLTDSAKAFVSELSLQAVSGNPVSTSLLDPAAEAAMGHIELAKWCDTVLIAPATANVMAKLAHGLADDLLTTLCLATPSSIFVAPAMNQQMWAAQATQDNLHILSQRGVKLIGPGSGEQACGDVGLGRMLEPEEIVSSLIPNNKIEDGLAGVNVLITAGPTREAIDPVRFLSNHSSGKMGYAIAKAASQAGANVTLVSGPVSLQTPTDVNRVDVSSASDMHKAVMSHVSDCDIFIGCAAVADYRPVNVGEQKIKKDNNELTLTFTKNPDILADVAKLDHAPFTVGFAAETQNVRDYALKKLKAKRLNMIAANDVSNKDIGFDSDKNALSVFWNNGEEHLAIADKEQLAFSLIELITKKYKSN